MICACVYSLVVVARNCYLPPTTDVQCCVVVGECITAATARSRLLVVHATKVVRVAVVLPASVVVAVTVAGEGLMFGGAETCGYIGTDL